MSITSLKAQAELALAKLTEGKRFLLSDLNEKLQVAVDENPQDTVIKAMASVVEQIYNKNPEQIISQGDIEKLYNELIGLNASGTRFREVLGDLLISEGPKTLETNEKYIKGMRDPTEGFLDYDIDSEVKNGFDHFFEPASNRYDPQNAVFARNKVEMELRTLGFDRARVKLAGGNSRFLVFASDLDTNQGAVRVYIPADASGQQLPSVFVAGDRFDELSKPNLENYMSRAPQLRNHYLPEISSILNSLDIITGNMKKAISEEDFSKISSGIPESNGSEGLAGPGVFASLPNPADDMKDVEIPRTAIPEPLKIIASQVEESILETTVGYPQTSVRLAKRMLVAELTSMGFKGSQIRVAAPMADGFICEADINTPSGKLTIELPTEMKESVPLLPSVFAHGDYVDDFTAPRLQAFVLNKTGRNETIVASDSSFYGLNLSQLKDVMVKSAMDSNFGVCDEVIEVVAQKFDEDTYRNVISDYYEMLMNLGDVKERLASSFDDSDQFIKTPNSIYPIHKKLGRPAHDLVKDENGVYHLKSTYDSRKKQVEEGAFFSNAKVLVGD